MLIQSNASNTKNIFSMFPEYNLGNPSVVQNDLQIKVASTTTDTIDIQKPQKYSRKKKIIFGSTLASTILGAGILSLILVRGVNKGSTRKLSAMGERLTRDIQEADKLKTNDLMTRCIILCKKGMKKTLDFLQATSNTNAIKDGAVDNVLRSNKVTRPFAEKTKKLFQNVVNKTLGKKYRKVGANVDELAATLKHYKISDLKKLSPEQKGQLITIKGVTKTLGEWTDDLARHTQELSLSYSDGFSADAIVGRNKKRSSLLAGLSDKVKARFFKNKGLFRAENYRTYATEELAKPAQDELRFSILSSRKRVTNNIQSIHDSIKTNLSIFSESAKADDEIAVKAIKSITKKLETFKSCSGSDEFFTRAKISDDIAQIVDETLEQITNSTKYSRREKNNLIKQLSAIKDTALSSKGNSKGALEEIESILKGLRDSQTTASGIPLVSDGEIKHFSKLSNKIRSGLTKASELEMGEYFLKQAELEVGSAANDVISVLLPVGVGAYSIGKGEDKDERISAVLTTCIPLVGTFATFVYGTAKMFSGAKNLIFSGVSGLLLGKLGNYCDKLYKEYRKSGSVVEVAKEEYDKFWTDITPKYAEPLKEETTDKEADKTKSKK